MNPKTLTANELNQIGKQSGYTGTPFSSIGLSAPTVSNTMDANAIRGGTSSLNLSPQGTPLPVPNIGSLPTDTIQTPTQTTPVAPTQDPTSSAWKSAFDKVTGLFSQKQNKESDLATATEEASAPYTKQLNEVNQEIKMHQANAVANQEKAMQQGETTGFASREAQNVARTDAIEALKLAAIQTGLQGNISLAETHATNAINAKFADINKQIEDAKTNIYNNYDSLSPSEKKQADLTLLRLDKDDAFAKTKMEDEKIQAGFIQQAIAQSAQNGKPIDMLTLKRANSASTPEEALQILAPYLVDADAKASALLDRQIKQANLTKLNNEIADHGLNTVVTNPKASKFAGALNVILGSTKLTKDQKNNLIKSINTGQDPATVVRNQAKEIMGQTEATKLTNYEVARDTFLDIGKQLQEFYDAGGNTGLIKGNLEEVANKLGQVKDLKLVPLATQIKGNIQVYRNAVSGTAYSTQEGKDINSIFPGINNSKTLNDAIIKGRSSLFDSVIDATYRTALGKDAYEAVLNASTSKSGQTDQQFVEQAVQNSGKSYQDILSGSPQGQIPVVNNKTGEIGYIPVEEFTNEYTKL